MFAPVEILSKREDPNNENARKRREVPHCRLNQSYALLEKCTTVLDNVLAKCKLIINAACVGYIERSARDGVSNIGEAS